MHIPTIILDPNWMQFSCTYYNFLWQRAEAKFGERIVFLLNLSLPHPQASLLEEFGDHNPLGNLLASAWYPFPPLPLTPEIDFWYRMEIFSNESNINNSNVKSSLETTSDIPYIQGTYHPRQCKSHLRSVTSFSTHKEMWLWIKLIQEF